jgi:putative phage-type endonuclease
MSRIIEAAQGSAAWHKHRASHFNASDAPAMMGVSSYKSRGDLLREKKTGIVPEVDPQTQKRFDDGHKYEAVARPWAEEIVGEELYPVVMADDGDDLPLSASLDGLTMDDDTVFEHKSSNEKLRTIIDAGDALPEEHRVQMEQQMFISGAKLCLFMVSSGDREQMRHCWYKHDPELQQRVIAGWHQFAYDLHRYEPPAIEKPVTGSAPSALPALRIELSGAVAESNLEEFRDHAIAVFDGINTDLQTDEDFASAEETVKWCAGVENKLSAAKDHALSQTADIDYLFRTIDEISEQARKKRLELDKLVKSMKEQRKEEILRTAERDYDAHIGEIEKDLERGCIWPIRFPAPSPMISQAMKGKRTIATLRDAAETAVANAKIEADRIAREIRASIEVLKAEAEGYESLFPDGGQLVTTKSADDLRNLAKARIAEHQEQERQRSEREAEQKRIRNERKAESGRYRAAQQSDKKNQPEETEFIPTDQEQTQPAEQPASKRPAPTRPTDDQIIGVIAASFYVKESTARDWIAAMNVAGAYA